MHPISGSPFCAPHISCLILLVFPIYLYTSLLQPILPLPLFSPFRFIRLLHRFFYVSRIRISGLDKDFDEITYLESSLFVISSHVIQSNSVVFAYGTWCEILDSWLKKRETMNEQNDGSGAKLTKETRNYNRTKWWVIGENISTLKRIYFD